jgi:adenylate cyclase
MGTEIERKFLVKDTTMLKDAQGVGYRQGYLVLGERRTVRVRIGGERAYLTIKGPTVGMSRAEFEYAIPVTDANAMLDTLCHQPIIEKTRYKILHDGFVWEVDVFAGANAGLVIAEIELKSEQTRITLPEWVGQEVTGDVRYFNAYLVEHPYTTWDKG